LNLYLKIESIASRRKIALKSLLIIQEQFSRHPQTPMPETDTGVSEFESTFYSSLIQFLFSSSFRKFRPLVKSKDKKISLYFILLTSRGGQFFS
jgi:hypothetical protein